MRTMKWYSSESTISLNLFNHNQKRRTNQDGAEFQFFFIANNSPIYDASSEDVILVLPADDEPIDNVSEQNT